MRNEQTLILRKTKTKDALFVSTIESHGTYSPVSELAVNAYSNIDKIAVVYDSKEYTAIQISMKKGRQSIFIISNEDNNQNTDHIISLEGYEYRWKGSYFLTNIK